jgi:hypothetical protein
LDNARLHNYARATDFINGNGSSDYRPPSIFLECFKKKLKNCRARPFDELKQEVDSILTSIPEVHLISVFQTWLRRLQQVIESGREYI